MTRIKNDFWTEVVILLLAVYVPVYCLGVWNVTSVWIFLSVWTILAVVKAYFNNRVEEDEQLTKRNKKINTVLSVVMIAFGLIIALTSCDSVKDNEVLPQDVEGLSDDQSKIKKLCGLTSDEFGALHNDLLVNYYETSGVTRSAASSADIINDDEYRESLIDRFVEVSLPIVYERIPEAKAADMKIIRTYLSQLSAGMCKSYSQAKVTGVQDFFLNSLVDPQLMGDYVLSPDDAKTLLFGRGLRSVKTN